MLRCSTTANDPSHRRIVSGDTPKHRLAQQAAQEVARVLAAAVV